MNYPYPTFFLDVQLAKRRLAQVLATGRGVPGDDLFPPSNKSVPVANAETEAVMPRLVPPIRESPERH
ncbi:MAG TPA: hypothetical protein VGF37_03805 [Chthoniobacterales bacterium]|jgi:hypothetical protein